MKGNIAFEQLELITLNFGINNHKMLKMGFIYITGNQLTILMLHLIYKENSIQVVSTVLCIYGQSKAI